MSEYQNLVSDLRGRAAKLIEAANLIESALGGRRPEPLRVVKGGKTNGTAAVVLAAIKDGHDKIPAIAKDAKIRESTARAAIITLESAGKVKRDGKGRSTRYLAA
jgi:hypothetical protein